MTTSATTVDEHISYCAGVSWLAKQAEAFERMLTRWDRRMDELGYPPINHSIVRDDSGWLAFRGETDARAA